MLTGIAKEERYEYVSKLDTTEPKTIFVLGNIPARMKIKFATEAAEQGTAETGKFKFTGDLVELVTAGLKQIRNGDTVIEPITDEILGRIPMEVLIELVGEIFKANALGADEKKN